MGSAVVKSLEISDIPRVGLLNIGSEEFKGKDEIKLAAELLNKSNLNYQGFVEGNGMFSVDYDVIVTDGFTGNIALKTAEGTAKLFQSHLRDAFKSSILSRLGYFLSSLAMKSVKERLDPRVHNCGILIGLNSLVVKCHGQSESKGVSYASDIIYSLLENNVNEKIQDYVDRIRV